MRAGYVTPLPNNSVPEVLIRRLDQAGDVEREGIEIAAELLQQLADVPGIHGAHMVATRNLEAIAAAVNAAGFKR